MSPVAAADRLWTPEESHALTYLTERGLKPGAIRAARLGYAPRVEVLTNDGRSYTAQGVVLPWFASGLLALIKVRQPEGSRPKYAEVYRDSDRPPLLYPGPGAIRPGSPLVIVEGEFDCLLIAQELADWDVDVVTLGSASMGRRSGGIDPAILGTFLSAAPWLIATDSDEAGDQAAAIRTGAYS